MNFTIDHVFEGFMSKIVGTGDVYFIYLSDVTKTERYFTNFGCGEIAPLF